VRRPVRDFTKERLNTQGKGSHGKPLYAAAVVADGNVIAVSRRGGMFVFEAKKYFKFLDNNKIESEVCQFHGTPALSDGQIFLQG
jgi:hypothetical protein